MSKDQRPKTKLKKMAYCYECGEKVAELDVFCPYCGISLKPVAVEGSDDVSMDKTVVISGGDSIEIPAMQDFSRVDLPKAEEVPAPVSDVSDYKENPAEFASSTGDLASSKTEESINMKTDSVELSSEIIAENVAPQPIEPVVEEKFEVAESKIEPNFSDDNSDLPEPTHIEILKPIEENSDAVLIDEKPAEELTPTPIAVETSEENEIVNFDAPVENVEKIETQAENLEDSTPFDNSADYKFDIENETPSEIENVETVEESEDISQAETLMAVDDPAIIESLDEKVEEVSQPIENSTEGALNSEFSDEDYVATQIHPSQSLEKVFEEIDINKFDAPINAEIPVSEDLPATENNQTDFVAENENSANLAEKESISKPEDNLEIPEPPKNEAIFDSVQIVQTEKPSDDFEQKVAQAEAAQGSGEVGKESRSYTTPIVSAENTDGKKAAKLKPLEEGTILNNRYEIVRKIGGGGMGAVYLASDKNLGGVLRAVKEMVQSYIEEVQQDKAIADFKRESMLLTSLEHSAIPTIYDYFFDEKEARFYLVMKYISGGDLSGRLRAAAEGKIDEKTVTEWGIQIADVLHYLHSHEPAIVYRDLKPANVMIDGNSGRLMLIDFGIARWINKEEKGVTAVGTMGYAPPELFSGNVEPRSDIYSLGSTMFHLLTGADPQSNPLLIFDFQKNPRPRQINSALSDQIEKILMQSVEYTADKRFTSAAEMKKTLEEHLENLKVGRVSFGVKDSPVAVSSADQYVFCGFCGQRIIGTDVFCAFCGSQQPIAGQQPAMSSSSGHARLTLVNTEEISAPIFSLDKDSNIIGRRDPMSNIFPEVDLSKFDPQTKISRRHARIWREGINYLVEDLGSSNGTILLPALSDTVRLLPHQPHILTNGDKIKIGDTTMNFVVG